MCTARPLDPTSATACWWAERGVVLDAVAHPELAAVLDGAPACAVRPDRYVFARGSLEDLTARAAVALEEPAPPPPVRGTAAVA